MIRRALIVLASLAVPAAAQVRPQPGLGDPRVQTVDYRHDQVVTIAGGLGYQVTIALAPDEQVQSIAVGDPGAWQVSVNRAGNLLFVKPVQADAETNMTVVTNARFYAFDLRAGGANGAPWEVRFRYPAETAVAPPGPSKIVGYYRISGTRALLPTAISDDGEKTYIEWSPDAALPAVFVIDERGREALANGNMRGNLYVIDSVPGRLLFRLDDRTARASRLPPGDSK